jgi:hypothetical protein
VVLAAGSFGESFGSGSCGEKLSHPLHTYRIAGLCLQCRREREERLARFEVGCIRDGVEREAAAAAASGGLGGGRSGSLRSERRGGEGWKAKVKVKSPGLRSEYAEGRGRGWGQRQGMILERNGEGVLVDGRTEGEGRDEVGAGPLEAMGWDPEMGAFEGEVGAGRGILQVSGSRTE